MTFDEELQTFTDKLKTEDPPEVALRLSEMDERLRTHQVGASAPRQGEPAPDASFLSTDDRVISLHDLFRDRPLVLVFYRGRWCPFCDFTMRAYETQAEQFRQAGARLVAVSPQTAAESALTSEGASLTYEVLSDPRNEVASAFGLEWEFTSEEKALYEGFGIDLAMFNGNKHWVLPAPAVFLIDTFGIVRASWVDSDWTHRTIHSKCSKQ